MASENTSGTSDIPFALMRRHAALALEIAGLSCENRLRLQQLDEQALQDLACLIHTTAQNVRQAANRADMATMLSTLSSAHVHIAAQFWMHWLGAIVNNQQALGACAANACSEWASDLNKSDPGSALGTDMNAYWANACTNFNRILQTLNPAADASPEEAKAARRA